MDNRDLFNSTIQRDLLSFASSFVRNEEDAQDIVQEVFGECLTKSPEILDRSYLFKAVRNRSLNRVRNQNRYLKAIEEFSQYLKDTMAPTGQGDHSVMGLVQKLPEKQREVLILRVKAELKISEIAEILGIPQGTVKSRINSALASLRGKLKGRGHESQLF